MIELIACFYGISTLETPSLSNNIFEHVNKVEMKTKRHVVS